MSTRTLSRLAAALLSAALLAGGTLVAATALGPSAAAYPSRTAVLPCRHGHLCGADQHGHSFDYSVCQEYRLPGLVGIGLYNNNQTTGTRAIFYEANHFEAFHIKAPNHGRMNWTPIEFVRPC
jgi:hypothetical protein